MQPHAPANELRCENIAFDKLSDEKNAQHDQNQPVGRPKLCNCHAERKDKTCHRSYVRDEGNQARNDSDEQTEIESGKRECDSVKGAEDKANRSLSAEKPGNRSINLAGQFAHGLAMLNRDPTVNTLDHTVPVVDQVKSYNGRHDDKREY